MDILVGADPELFVKDGRKSFRSAHGLIPGTKKDPFKVDGGAVQVDGMALEFNIDPAANSAEFVANINRVMATMKTMIPENYEFALLPTAKFTRAEFDAAPDEAKELGCEPDFNAYTLEANPKPDNTTTMRTASGHVHIGFGPGGYDTADPEHMQRCATLVKQLDCYLGLPSLLWDYDTKRRTMYGAPGAFRPKPFGVEYRVLSNRWLASDSLKELVFDLTKLAVDQLVSGVRPFENKRHNLRDYLNGGDPYIARTLIDMYNVIPGVTTKMIDDAIAASKLETKEVPF